MSTDYIAEAIYSFQEYQRIVKYPTNEAEYIEWVIPLEGASLTKTWGDVQIKASELQSEYDLLAYSRSRQQEYPSIQECIHAILDDDLTALQVKRQAVKDKYPKGSN
jgi:coenzyme F420-reducing hydrogenase alpha subunit